MQPDSPPYFSPPTSLRRSPRSQTALCRAQSPSYRPTPQRQNADSRFSPTRSPLAVSTRSTQEDMFHFQDSSSETTSDDDLDDIEELVLPNFALAQNCSNTEGPAPPSSPQSELASTPDSATISTTPLPTPELIFKAEDDTALKHEPSRHVDYLSHNWREEDIWSSWKHIVSKRRIYGERSRLENASWRTWAKQKDHLKTVPADTLNWYLPYTLC
jgi:hypothetical protein